MISIKHNYNISRKFVTTWVRRTQITRISPESVRDNIRVIRSPWASRKQHSRVAAGDRIRATRPAHIMSEADPPLVGIMCGVNVS